MTLAQRAKKESWASATSRMCQVLRSTLPATQPPCLRACPQSERRGRHEHPAPGTATTSHTHSQPRATHAPRACKHASPRASYGRPAAPLRPRRCSRRPPAHSPLESTTRPPPWQPPLPHARLRQRAWPGHLDDGLLGILDTHVVANGPGHSAQATTIRPVTGTRRLPFHSPPPPPPPQQVGTRASGSRRAQRNRHPRWTDKAGPHRSASSSRLKDSSCRRSCAAAPAKAAPSAPHLPMCLHATRLPWPLAALDARRPMPSLTLGNLAGIVCKTHTRRRGRRTPQQAGSRRTSPRITTEQH
jgi:hypothetical protein